MEPGVFEIFGTRYYTHGFGLVFVAPFALWFAMSLLGTLWRLLSRKQPAVRWGLYVSALLTVVSFVVVFWDVYLIGQQATRLCKEEGGLHVYKTVEAEGFIGVGEIRGWGEYGFKFTEREDGKHKIRYFYENGKPTYKNVDQFLSKYEFVTKKGNITPRIEIIKQEIREINTSKVLGESNEFSIDGGWADMFFYNTTGFSYSPWICSGRNERQKIYPSDLVKAVLKPNIP